MENAIAPVYQTLKHSRPPADLSVVNENFQLTGQPVRSKGQATLLLDGLPELLVVVRDISPSGIGVVADRMLHAGALVDVSVHGHSACGTVASCRPEGPAFYIAIDWAA